jgi:signal transduction histidine kinase
MPLAGYIGDDGYVDEPTQSPESPGPPLPGQAPSWGQPFGLPNGQPPGQRSAGQQSAGQQSAGQQSAGQAQPPKADQPPPAWSHQHRGADWSARVSSLRRASDGRIAGGIAAGISARTGMHVGIVRTIFIVLALITGFGLAVYVVAWLFIPAVGENNNIASRAITDLRGIAIAAVAASMLVVVLVLVTILGIGLFGKFGWPIVIAAAGLVLIWRNASADEQASLQRLADPLVGSSAGKMRSKLGLRLLIAGVLLIIGLTVLASAHHPLLILRPLGGLVLVLAAIGVVLGPWWLRIVRDLVVERQARIRAEERADIAARVHDSVLQTLALIQRRADSPQQVIQLARAQERELRSWLFDGRAPGSMEGVAATFAAAVRRIQQDVEEQHGVAIEAVTVGDSEIDDDLNALLAAAREATVNAAKWSGAQVVSVFAEVEPSEVSVFVRDRGRGFDPATVPSDRKGLAESVQARMERRGGSATIRSVLGEGTEVSLTMPRTAGQREPSRAT